METRFRLEPVLRHRKHIEEDIRRELRHLLQQLADDERKMSEICLEKEKWDHRLREIQKTELSPAESLLYLRYLQRISNRIQEQNGILRQRRAAVDQKRDQLLSAVKDLKMMEALKKKWKAASQREQDRRERIFLDEIAVGRFNRRMTEYGKE